VADGDPNWNVLWNSKIHHRFKLLIWRIATGILPTKINLALKLGYGDTRCPLCLEHDETLDHLFFQCPVSRAIWFGTTWSIHSSLLSCTSYQDIINVICKPSLPLVVPGDKVALRDQTSIQFALILECIWNLRNHVIFNDHKINILATIKALELRIVDHMRTLENTSKESENLLKPWRALNLGTIKINVNAALSPHKASLAAVARDQTGSILNICADHYDMLDPIMAEAKAICWGLELALAESFTNIAIQSDSKSCIDALSNHANLCSWKITTLISSAIQLAFKFESCVFLWVRREANQVTDTIAKVAISHHLPFCCSKDNLPPSVKEAWLRDMLLLFS
jgi:ribonuclease HI